MRYLLLILTLSFPLSANIFTDGTIQTSPPSVETINIVTGDNFGSTFIGEILTTNMDYYCEEALVRGVTNYPAFSHSQIVGQTATSYSIKCYYFGANNSGPFPQTRGIDFEEQITEQCPSNGYPNRTYPYFDQNGLQACADPTEIELLDSCNSADTFLNKPVTDANVCHTLSDGSICPYSAVDIGDQQMYSLEYESSCYQDNAYPPSNSNSLGSLPIDDSCTTLSTGLLACSSDFDTYCPNGQCNSNCGFVNDQFLCFDQDTDLDGLPDYNDPDIDGDGIPNSDDLDSDGDGQDDPIDQTNNNTNSGTGNTNVVVNVNTQAIVDELKDINSNFDTSHGQTPTELNNGDRLTNLNDEYESTLTGIVDSTAQELGFVDELNLSNTIAINATDQCQPYEFLVGSLGNFSLDLCDISAKTNPILYWIFGFGTAFYMFMRVNQTLRGN